MRRRIVGPRLFLGLLAAGGCSSNERPPPPPLVYEDFDFAQGSPDTSDCDLFPGIETTLLVTTTDFATGAVSTIDIASHVASLDVAAGSPDAIPFRLGDSAVVVNRFQFDSLSVLSSPSWRSQLQLSLSAPDVESPNPHSLAMGSNGAAYIPLFGSRYLLKTRLAADATPSFVDLGIFADADGRPEASIAFRCGGSIWTTIQRYDWENGTYRDSLIALDTETDLPYDLDNSGPEANGIPLLGTWAKQIRGDPSAPRRNRVLALTTGVEQIDLEERTSQWVLHPEALEQVRITTAEQPIAFDVDEDLTRVFIAAYTPPAGSNSSCEANISECFNEASIFEFRPGSNDPPRELHRGIQAVAPALELVDDVLWVGTREPTAPGILVFDTRLRDDPLIEGPINVGLPPYSMTSL